MKNRYIYTLLLLAIVLGLQSCSTTSRLEQGQTLYTGVKKINYQSDSVKLDADVQDQIFEAINVKPNNPLYSPYYRTPFPIGLWVYNHWDENSTGLKGWLYKKLVAQPVTISSVRPKARVDMINTLLHNNGYFDSYSSYELDYANEKHRKARITYNVQVNAPYTIGTIQYLESRTQLGGMIDSLARINKYLQTGSRYCLDSLNNVRIDIANELRDRGYYFYRPEYIQYLADSIAEKGKINLKIVNASNIPNMANRRYLAHNVVARVSGNHGGGTPDTVVTRNCTLIKMQPVNIKDNVITENIRSRKGRPFRVGNMDRTQLYLSRLGIFSTVNMNVVPFDSVTPDGDGFLDVSIDCTLDKPYEVKTELKGTSKSNSFVGPGMSVGVANKNVFGGGEQLSVDLDASYEWQTGRKKGNNDRNSYEFGLDVSLAFPRLLAPKFVDRSRRYLNWTRLSLTGDIMNRPSYFKMAQFGTKFTWEWHANKHSLNEFTPFKLTYQKLLSSTASFDSAMIANPAIALSFQNTFIPSMSYSYTYDNTFGSNNITWSYTVTEAGNIFAGIWDLAGSSGKKKLFGTAFSQFVKAQTQFVLNHDFGSERHLVTRAFVGAAHAYGNSSQVPYSEQFYVGGANSVRAFTVRTVGPGSYKAASDDIHSFYDQTGTFKLEMNLEYRFPIFSYFKGAFFLDAGNVWLLKDDENRPGGQLKMNKFFDQLALGTGAGIRFDMEMLVLRVDVGVGLHAPYDTGRSGYYNLKFKDSLALHIAIGYPF